MKFTLSWLKTHLDTDASLTAITEKLTAIGLELEGIENPADAIRPFRVAQILEAAPHPNADKLQLLKVADGSDAPWQVVCGAANARAGLKGVFAPPGTYVPGLDFTLKAAKIRDVESFGMMCAEDELGLGESHDGIIELPDDAPVGASYADYAGLDDPVIEVSVTPDRADCMGVRGIARDLAAAGMGTLRPLAEVYGRDTLEPIKGDGSLPEIAIADHDGCPAFFAQNVSGLTNGVAPDWMAKRLTAIGQSLISMLVDITNYVSIDLGRPLHVYDRAKLSGPLTARKANAGEEVAALNGKTYTLTDAMTVIADAEMVHDIGGVMGGEHSGVSESTTDVLIECAYFDPAGIAGTGQALQLTSDARQRFERGVDPAFLDDGLAIATHLVLTHCGGVASDVRREGAAPVAQPTFAFDPALCVTLGGMEVPEEEQRRILNALGFIVTADWQVTPPSWRRDVLFVQDIVGDIVRMVGLDKLPSTPLPRVPGVAKPTATPVQLIERKARRAAAACGLNEAVNWSFLPQKEADVFGGGEWVLANPISEDLKVMRPSLLPGLLSAAKRNRSRGAQSVRLFEIGRRYFKAADGTSDERLTVGIVLTGEKMPRDWQAGKSTNFTPFDIKGDVMAICDAIGLDAAKLMALGANDFGHGPHFHPGQSATLRQGPQKIVAAFGALHPTTAKAFGLKGAVMAAEIFLDAVPVKRAGGPIRAAYAPPSLQSVTRDFAFVVDDSVAAGDLLRAVAGADKVNIIAARLFDRFMGDGVAEGKQSLAVEITLQPIDKSYTDEDLAAISAKVVAAAAKLGGELRA
jgi:phenylalanyl-tRNA synthetase beta chain